MRVIILNDYAYPGGGSSAVALMSARGLAEQGHSVTMLTAVGPVAPEYQQIANLEIICLDQQEIARDSNRLRAFVGGIHNRRAVTALRRLLGACDPEDTVVHVHTWAKALSAGTIDAALDLGFKVIYSLHDFFIACPTGTFFEHPRGEICRRKPLSSDCLTCRCDRRSLGHKLWRSARTYIQNRLLHLDRRISHYVGISDFSVSILKEHLPDEAQVTVIRNPVECEKLEPASVETNAPLVFTGRMAMEKGPLLFAKAAHRLQIPAVFVGDGELRQQVQEACPGATFTGWQTPAEVAQWMRRARALVFPPLWYETLGLVVIEAAAHGVPSIVSDQSAATDHIQHGVNGLRFEGGSVDSLCDGILQMLDAQKAKKLGKQAYDWYWDRPWSTESHVNSLVALYEQVLVEL